MKATPKFARTLLLVCLLAGAMLGGWTAGRFRHTRIDALGLLRCLAGGVLMGWGSLLIPGGNDGLILVGMPLLWPYAWVAFITILFMLPTASPVTKTNFNYTPLAVLAVVGFAGIWWLVSAKNWFTGPKVQGSAEELAAMERELESLA